MDDVESDVSRDPLHGPIDPSWKAQVDRSCRKDGLSTNYSESRP
jgi:hypothetical protein